MFCPQCGFQLEDNANFCGKCGRKITYNSVNQANKSEIPVSRPVFVPSNKQNKSADVLSSVVSAFGNKKHSSIPVINEFKKLCLSPLAIIAVAAFVLTTIINFVNSEYLSVQLYSIVSSVADISHAPILDSVLDFVETSIFMTALIANLPAIVTSIGLCMVMYSAMANKNDVSSSGFGLIRIVNSVRAVFIIIVMILFAIVCIAAASKTSEAFGVILVAILILGVLGFMVYCLFKINDSIDSVRYALDRHIPTVGISRLVTFIAFAAAVVSFINLFTEDGNAAINLFGAISNTGFGILTVQYRSRMEALRYLPKEENEDGSAKEGFEPVVSYSSAGSSVGKIAAAVAVVLVVVIGAVAIFKGGFTGNPDVDERIVGKWRYNSNAEAVMQFKSNGVYIGNEGTDHEEKGTFRTENGVIYITVDGEETEHNYRIINDDRIEIERKFYNSNWTSYYKYVELYKVT